MNILEKACVFNKLHEIFKITQWKNSCVYKTKSLGYVIANKDDLRLGKNYKLTPPSTAFSRRIMSI